MNHRTTARHAQLRQALLLRARAFGLVLAVAAATASAINIPEGTSKLQMGSEINKAYLVPLGLKGEYAAHAMGKLLSEGFLFSFNMPAK